MNRVLRSLVESVGPPVILFGIVLGIWQALTAGLGIRKYLLPRPADVWFAASENARQLLAACQLTAEAALVGFVFSLLCGIAIAMIFSQSRIVQRSFFPYAIFLQTVPIVAIAPIIITWFGPGFQSVVLVAFIISLFPIITGATAGLTLVDANLRELFEIYNATRWQVLWKLRLPHSVPYLVTAAKTSGGLAVIGAIVGEFFAGYGTKSSYGLGYLITMTAGQMKTGYLFATVFCSTLLGLAMFVAISGVGRLILWRWRVASERQTMAKP